MIKKTSEAVALWLEKEGVVSNERRNLYAYATYSMLFGLLPFLFAIIWGIVFSMLKEALLLILPFMLIRKFSGGYHLDSPGHCIIFSNILIAVSLALIKFFFCNEYTFTLTVLVISAVVSLCLLSPIDSEARRLSSKEKRLFRKIARIISLSALVMYLIMQCCGLHNIGIPFGVGVLLAASLQVPCILIAKAKK